MPAGSCSPASDVTHAPVQGRDMAMIFQTFALYPHLSTFDNLAYPLRERRVARAEVRKRVDADRRDAAASATRSRASPARCRAASSSASRSAAR